MIILIKYRASIYGPDPKKEGETKLLFKDKLKKGVIELEDIDAVFNYHGKNGKENPRKCEIVHKTMGNIVLDMPFKEIAELRKNNRFTIKGFYYKK